MRLKLVSNLTKIEYEFTGLTDTLESRMFYSFEIVLPDNIADGEYTYTLYDGDDVSVASGLCQIGDYSPDKKEYTKENKQTYIQYNG